MSKLYRSLLWSGLVVAGVAACGDDLTITPPPPPPAPTVRSVSVAPNPGNIAPGGTLQMIASVNADAGVATTVAWTSSNSAVVSVSAAGLATAVASAAPGTSVAIQACATAATGVCGQATVVVTAAVTPTVTGVTVTPSGNVTFVVGQAPITFVASVQGTNSPSQTVTWSTGSGGSTVVSVGAATGIVTVVGAGTEVVKACANAAPTVCGSVSVTVQVAQPTQISIQGITQGSTVTPVNLANVSGQVDVILNVEPGAGSLVKVQVLIDGVVAAEQCFTSTTCPVSLRAEVGPASAVQTVVLSLNTAQIKKLANGLYIPVAFNGPRNFSARLFTSLTTSGLSSNVIPVVLQNPDAMLGGPTVTNVALAQASSSPTFTNSVPAAGTVWYKGNVNVTGGSYISFFPVTPAISWVSNVAGCGPNSGNATSGTPTTGITTSGVFTCNTTVEGQVGLTGAYVVTPGTAPAPDFVYIAAVGFSTVGTVYVVNGDNRYNLFAGGAAPAPTGPFIDNKAPAIAVLNVAYNDAYDQAWINATYDLGVNDITSTDGGTGVFSEQVVLDPADLVACNGAAVPSPHGLAETLTSSGGDSYRICGGATDNIGNASGFTGPSNPFGVDNTVPLSRLAGSSLAATPSIAPSNTSAISTTANTTIYATAAQINSQVFGLEGFDTRSGFNQNVVAGSDAATQVLTRTLQSGVTGCAVNDQLTQVLSDSWIRMPILTLIECGSGLAGYYDYSGNVNDRAGNFSSPNIVRNFAYDLTAPVTSFVSPAQTTYTPGLPAAFNVIASDDVEVLLSFLSFSFTGMGPPAAGIVYPYGSVAGLTIGSPWPSAAPISALVPSTGTTGMISIPYLLGRIDDSCTGLAVPYPSCSATLGSKTIGSEYNRDLNLNAPTPSNANQAPTAIVTNVQDIALRDGLAGAVFSFNPVTFVTPVAEQWSAATAIDTWIGKNGTGDCPAGTICADQKTQTSNGLQFFTTVSLWRLNTATNQWTFCGDLTPQGPPPFVDNGVYRIWRSTTSTPGGSTTCGALTGFYRVMGTLNGAGLFSPSF